MPATTMHDSETVIFAEELPGAPPKPALKPFKLLIVDDEPDVHLITQRVLEYLTFEERGLTYLNAYSGKEARAVIREHPDTAVILLDVVMETEDAGLQLVRYIREELRNPFVRIILRTAHPGEAPEKKIILEYDIHDYKEKILLTDQGLVTVVISALRTYRDLRLIEQHRKDLERAMEDVKIAHKARFQFLANMGHELRTPLHQILGFAELLTMTDLTDKQKKYIEVIKESGVGLSEVLNNVLAVTESVEGLLTLHEEPFLLRETIAEIMRIIEIQAQWKQLHTTYQIAEDVPDLLVGDSKRLKQVLMNLFGNAIKYTKEGEISLSVSRKNETPDQLLFAVKDTGIGITKDKYKQIFEPFELGEDALTKHSAGVGLGLAISKDIIEKMQGRIWVESEPAQGSTFYFSITLKTMR